MNDKKSLDRLFQEKFKDFESEPNPQVWKNIEAALKEKDDRKVIPFWWKLSGVAAVLLLGLFAWNLISDNSTTKNGVVLEQNKINSAGPSENDAVVNTANAADKGKVETNPSENHTNNAVAEETNAGQNAKVKNSTKMTTVNSDNDNAVTNSTKTNKKKATKTTFQNNKANTAIASENSASNKKYIPKRRDKGKNALKTTDANAVKNNSGIAGVSSEQSKNNQPTKAAASDQRNFGKSQPEKAVATDDSNKGKNLNNTTAANPNIATEQKVAVKEAPDNKKLDTVPAMIVPNALEELLKQKNEKETKVAETKLNRWQISSNVAPVYFSSTSQGSPIDKQFAGNDKTYENNLTYGVGVNYAVNKKLSVRAGIQKLNFNYNTNDVVFYAGLGAKAFNNISPAGNAAFLEVMSQDAAVSIGLAPGQNSLQDISTGAMTQRMGYIEVPLELSYKLIDRKFGISIIGGVSTLFLNENEVTVESSSSSTSAVLGKANNLNDVHFSSNLGIGFKYTFWKDFQFNFEPTFKYQINTFNKDSGNFKPYFIGLYSGVSFSF